MLLAVEVGLADGALPRVGLADGALPSGGVGLAAGGLAIGEKLP